MFLGMLITASVLGQGLQDAPQVVPDMRKAVPVTVWAVADQVVPSVSPSSNRKLQEASQRDVVVERHVVGTTNYDLQTNASMPQLVVGAGDDVSVAWMMSHQVSPFNDRGTGYNHYDGSGWQPAPNERVEDAKTGWTSIDRMGDGRDIVAGHSSPASLGIHLATSVPGSGIWEDQVIPNLHTLDNGLPVGHLWPRLSVGGVDGESVHVMCLSLPSYFSGGAPYEGMEGAVLYYRSTDYGQTWETIALPGVTSNEFSELLGDQYALHARGNKVALAFFNGLSDTVVLISEDNGDTWTVHTMLDFPVDLYSIDDGLPEDGAVDFDEDGVAQEHLSSDGGGTVHIDETGAVHVVFGAMHVSDTDLGDQQYEYYPTTNGLLYWREDFGEDSVQVIGYAQDMDGNGTLDLLDNIAYYRVGLAGIPSLGSAGDGTLVLSYASIMENFDTGAQNYRHIHVIHSTDHGDTWNSDSPCDVTPDMEEDGIESVFASLPHVMEDQVEMLYLSDFEPGVHIIGDQDPIGSNDLVHLRFALSDLTDCSEVIINDVASVSEQGQGTIRLQPNPASSTLVVTGWEVGKAELRLVDATGRLVHAWTQVESGQRLSLRPEWNGLHVLEISTGQTVTRHLLVVE